MTQWPWADQPNASVLNRPEEPDEIQAVFTLTIARIVVNGEVGYRVGAVTKAGDIVLAETDIRGFADLETAKTYAQQALYFAQQIGMGL